MIFQYQSLLSSFLFPSSLESIGITRCGDIVFPDGHVYGTWKQPQWAALWSHREHLCSTLHQGPYEYDQTIANVRIQVRVEDKFSTEHCSTALERIIGECFDSARRRDTASVTGSWSSGYGAVHEFYEMEIVNIDGWCSNTGQDYRACIESGI